MRKTTNPKSLASRTARTTQTELKVTLSYKVHDERRQESFAFIKDEDATRFEDAYRERTINVHYQPDNPGVSVLTREDNVNTLRDSRRIAELSVHIGAY